MFNFNLYIASVFLSNFVSSESPGTAAYFIDMIFNTFSIYVIGYNLKKYFKGVSDDI